MALSNITLINTHYGIDQVGNVYSFKFRKTKVLKPIIGKSGYKSVIFSINGIRKQYDIHRLLAQYFIANENNKPDINHIDGNKLNNNLENLEWVTKSENNKHALRLGLRIMPKGTNHYKHKNYKYSNGIK